MALNGHIHPFAEIVGSANEVDLVGRPTARYSVIYADPPWQFQAYSELGEGRSAERHYNCMDIESIRALPVADIAAENCALAMWVTDPTLPQAFSVLEAWGFRYSTVLFTWGKLNKAVPKTGPIDRINDLFMSMGYFSRKNPEMCILGLRGSPQRNKDARNIRQLQLHPRMEHSRKPEAFARDIERMFAGPYIELFARTQRLNWHAWGNQAETGPGLIRPAPTRDIEMPLLDAMLA